MLLYLKRGASMQKAKRLFIAALFSSIIFVINFFVPPPISYLLIVVQAVILALATFFVGKAGATYVGLVGGVLSALSRPAFGPFTFLFTFLFGLIGGRFLFCLQSLFHNRRGEPKQSNIRHGVQHCNNWLPKLLRNRRLPEDC